MKKPKALKDMTFQEQGEYYGYPLCCISEFLVYVAAHMAGFKPQRNKRKLDGTGYVPCKKCNEKSEKELCACIKKHRKCDLPFPQQYYE